MEKATTFTVPNITTGDTIVVNKKKKKEKSTLTYICWNHFY